MFGFFASPAGKPPPPAAPRRRRATGRKTAAKPAPPRPLHVPGLSAPLELRESARTRRFTLRVDAPRGVIRVVVPMGVAEAETLSFVARHADWLRERAARLPRPMPFADGATLPILGAPHVIRHDSGHRGPPLAAEGVLTVGGGAEFVARRVRDYLVKRARAEIVPRAHAKAAALAVRVAAVTLRDTKSRWGSCSAAGRLSFSWRLILAPEPVLDYVVAHEAAHLREMNHSPRFWALCAGLTADAAAGRAWLKAHGGGLFCYGG